MSDCRFGVSPVNYPDPDPVFFFSKSFKYLSISTEPEIVFLRKILKVQIFNLKLHQMEVHVKCSERLT